MTADQEFQDAIFDAIDGGLIVVDCDRRIVAWNKWMAVAADRPAASVKGLLLTDVLRGADHKRLSFSITSALANGAATILTHTLNPRLFALRTRAGGELLHDVTIAPLGAFPYAQCLIHIQDVTMPARRERYLREQQNARYDAIVESAPDVIFTTDADGVIQMINPAAAAQFGYTAAEVLGKNAVMLFETRDMWGDLWTGIVNGKLFGQPIEMQARRKDGSLSYLEASASRWNSGSRVFVTAILRDINDRRAADEALRESEAEARSYALALSDLNTTLEQRVQERTAQLMKAEEALRQSHKMEAIGQLTGGIAHDFNNMLQGITGALDLLQKRIAAGRIADTARFVTVAQESANRAAALTHRLLAFSRLQPVDPRPIDENQLVASIEELLRRTIGEKLKMKIVSAPDLWLVRCDTNQLENAILNLAINARDAMPDGGTLTVETANMVVEAERAMTLDIKPGEYARLSVADTGIGMPPEVQARAFDPFFTTKPIGKGTGLGLSMIYGFVRQSDGAIQIDSAAGRGTTINIYLPRFNGKLQSEEITRAQARERRSSNDEVVLVVEDVSQVRLLVVEVLNELGYKALEAEDGTSALRILNSPQRIDLLVTDIGLPDINGRKVADEALARRRDLKVLFMTGYAETAAGSTFLEADMSIITKPFTMGALASRVREIIEKRGR